MILHGIQPSFARGEFDPAMYARVDLQHYSIGARTLENFLIHPQGGASTMPGTEYVATVKNSGVARLIPFEYSTDESYVLEFGPLYIRVYSSDGTLKDEVVSTYDADDLWKIKYTQSANVLFLVCPGRYPRELTRDAADDTSWTLSEFDYTNGPFLDENTSDVTFTVSSVTGSTGITGESVDVTASEATFAAGDVNRWIKVRYMLEERKVSQDSKDVDAGDLPYTSASWEINGKFEFKYRFGVADQGGFVLEYSVDGGSNWDSYASISPLSTNWDLVDGELRREDYNGVTPLLRLTAAAETEPFYWELTQSREERIGYLKVASVTSSTVVRCTVMQDCEYLAKPTKLWSLGAWGTIPGYPETVMFYQDRLCFSNTSTFRSRIEMSRTGDYSNFDREIELQDDDGMSLTVPARSVNAIHSMIPMREMIVFSSGGIWSVAPGGNGDALTPTSVKVGMETAYRAGFLTPVVIGNVIFYVQHFSSRVCSLAYSDTVYGYDGIDVSVMSTHLFDGHTIVDWAYQQEPWSILWSVRDDGVILAFTFLKEHQVQAWSRRVLAGDGTAESLTVIPGETQDDVWIIAKRTVDGSEVRYIEKMTVRDETFLDCSTTFTSGTATTAVTGFTHLAGEIVSGVADGVAFSGKVVSAGGVITLDTAAKSVIAGLPYDCDLETLNIEYGLNDGTAQGRKKRVAEVILRLKDSQGGYVGPDEDHLMPLQYPLNATYPYTGDVRIFLNSAYDEGGRVLVRQTEPYPMTVLAVMPVISHGG